MTRTFETVQIGKVNMAHIMADYPHVLTPSDIGLFEPWAKAEALSLETDSGRKFRIMLLRQYLLPENDGSQLILTQHLSGKLGAEMGTTALLVPETEKLATVEAEIANNALKRLFRHWRNERGRKRG